MSGLCCILLVATSGDPTTELAASLRTYLDGDDQVQRHSALRALLQVPLPRLQRALRDGVWLPDSPTGRQVMRVKLPPNVFQYQPSEVVLWIPEDYDRRRSWPLLVALHGAGGHGKQILERWRQPLLDKGWIIACPTTTQITRRGYAALPAERQLVPATMRAVKQRWHIDSDRVFLTGVSKGGHGVWDCGLHYSDWFAGLLPEAGAPSHEGGTVTWGVYFRNALNCPLYVMVGKRDATIIGPCRQAVDQMKALGMNVTLFEQPERGHGIVPEATPGAVAFMQQQRRQAWPKRVIKVGQRVVQGRAYWIRVTALKLPEWSPTEKIEIRLSPGQRPPREQLQAMVQAHVRRRLYEVSAEVKPGNVIDISARNVARLDVLLGGDLIEWTLPVTIRANGRQVWKRLVDEDAEIMLQEFRRDRDAGRLVWHKLSLNVD